MTEQFRCEACERTFNDADGLAAHNKAKHSELIPKKEQKTGNFLTSSSSGKSRTKEKKPLPIKKIRNWVIFIIILGLIVWGIISLMGSANEKTIVDESNLNFEAPIGAIHWHPRLTIMIDGEKINIPANLGGHLPIHTHETGGTLHMENNNPTKKTVTLGYFFEVWGKRLSKDCIFEFCTDKGTLTMKVNGEENFEFENYFMQDGDNILIEYISGVGE